MNVLELDPRAVRTRRALVDAMAQMLEERETGDITVTDLVARAGVSRPSFYQHAGDIPSLVAAAGVDRLAAIFARSDALTVGLEGVDLARPTLHNIVADLAEQREFYRRVLRGVGGHDVSARVTDFVAGRLRDRLIAAGPDPRTDDLVVAIAAGATWLIIRWLDGDSADSPERMSERLLDVVLTLAAAATA
jgi:AcrR family transcriptional regulator